MHRMRDLDARVGMLLGFLVGVGGFVAVGVTRGNAGGIALFFVGAVVYAICMVIHDRRIDPARRGPWTFSGITAPERSREERQRQGP